MLFWAVTLKHFRMKVWVQIFVVCSWSLSTANPSFNSAPPLTHVIHSHNTSEWLSLESSCPDLLESVLFSWSDVRCSVLLIAMNTCFCHATLAALLIWAVKMANQLLIISTYYMYTLGLGRLMHKKLLHKWDKSRNLKHVFSASGNVTGLDMPTALMIWLPFVSSRGRKSVVLLPPLHLISSRLRSLLESVTASANCSSMRPDCFDSLLCILCIMFCMTCFCICLTVQFQCKVSLWSVSAVNIFHVGFIFM